MKQIRKKLSLFKKSFSEKLEDLLVKEKHFLKNIGISIASKFLMIFLSLISSIIITRSLGVEARGIFAIASAIGAIGVQFGNFGLHMSNTYYVAKDRDLLPTLLGNTLIASFGLGLIFVVGGVIFFDLFLGLIQISKIIIFVSLIGVPFGIAYLLMQNLLIGINRIIEFNIIEIVAKATTVFFILAIFILQKTSIIFFFFASLLGVLIACVLSFRQIKNDFTGKLTASFKIFIETLSYGSHIYMICLCSYLVLRSDIFLINYFLGNYSAGLYSISQMIADISYMVPSVIGSLLFPRLVSSDKIDSKKTTFIYSCSEFFALILLLLLSLILLKPIIVFMFGQEFAGSTNSSLILILSMAFYAVGNNYGGYILSFGKNTFLVILWLLALILNIILNIFLIPLLGIQGAAISTLIVYATISICNVIVSNKKSIHLQSI